jgi:hypothetical protein
LLESSLKDWRRPVVSIAAIFHIRWREVIAKVSAFVMADILVPGAMIVHHAIPAHTSKQMGALIALHAQ